MTKAWKHGGHKCPQCYIHHLSPEERDEKRVHFGVCAHCEKPCADMFMLEDHVWEKTGLSYDDGVLHIKCVEELIGRRVTVDDLLPNAGMNAPFFYFQESK